MLKVKAKNKFIYKELSLKLLLLNNLPAIFKLIMPKAILNKALGIVLDKMLII